MVICMGRKKGKQMIREKAFCGKALVNRGA
jgi:hypothetical protein